MGQQIRDLPEELQELCHQRQLQQGNDGTFTGNVSESVGSRNFSWDQTPEGYEFWKRVSHGDDLTNDPKYPKKKDEVITNYQIY